jgi:uncharacterized protein YndB with AHSA1/START domain
MATETRIRSTIFTQPNDFEVLATHVLDAPRDRVWAAHTEPRHITQWMLGSGGWTMPVCDMDVRVGGTWHWVWESPEGAQMEMTGKYLEVDPPARLVNTESWGPEWPETVTTLTLSEKDGRTTIRASSKYPTSEDRDAALATGMTDGWAESCERLDDYLR